MCKPASEARPSPPGDLADQDNKDNQAELVDQDASQTSVSDDGVSQDVYFPATEQQNEPRKHHVQGGDVYESLVSLLVQHRRKREPTDPPAGTGDSGWDERAAAAWAESHRRRCCSVAAHGAHR